MFVNRRLLAAATTVAAFGLPAAAHAGWSAPKPVSPADRTGSVSDFDIGFDADGDAVAAWTQSPEGEGNSELWVATRPAGGAWSAPKLLAADDPVYGNDDAFPPSVVVHPGGRAAVQWTENTPKIPYRTVVGIAVGEAGGAIGDSFVPHSTGVNHDPAEPVFAPDGTLHLVYQAGLNADNRIYERSLAPGATAWSEPSPVAPAMSVPQYELDHAIDADGNRALVWTSDYIDEQDINAAVRPAGGTWSAPAQLEANISGGTRPRVTITPQGRALAAWGAARLAAFAFGSEDQTWSAPATVASNATVVDMQSGADGVAHLLTQEGPALRHRTLAPDATTFGDAVAIDGTPDDHDFDPGLAVGPGGEAAAAWHDSSGNSRVALFDGDGWDASSAVNPEGVDAYRRASIAWDNLGSVVAGLPLRRAADGPEAADVVVLDRTAPDLVEASMQTTGVAGSALRYSAAATEDWSAIRYEWSFGDGGKATGASVEHTWAAAGRSSATLRIVSDGGTLELPAAEVVISPATEGGHHEEPKPEEKPVTQPPVTSTPSTPQTGGQPSLPTVAEVVKVLGTFPKAPVVTPAEASFEQSFPGPGKAKWDLFLGRPAAPPLARASAGAKAKPVLLGSSSKTIATAGKVKTKIKVSKKRRAALKRAKRPAVYLRTTFTDVTGRTVVAVKKVRFKRR